MQSLLKVLALCALVAHGAEPEESARPTMKEYKEDQKEIADGEKAAVAKQDKMAAVDKVISMLEDLQLQVLSEGEQEAATYNKFACFCKTTQKDKSEAIATGKDNKESLTAKIKKLKKQREALDKKIAEHLKNIKDAEAEMKKATVKSDKALALYKTNE